MAGCSCRPFALRATARDFARIDGSRHLQGSSGAVLPFPHPAATSAVQDMKISLSDAATKHSIASIKRYFAESLDQDIGDLKAALVLEFILKEVAPSVYNGAIADAQTYLRDSVADLDGACAVQEFAYWERSSVRRSPA